MYVVCKSLDPEFVCFGGCILRFGFYFSQWEESPADVDSRLKGLARSPDDLWTMCAEWKIVLDGADQSLPEYTLFVSFPEQRRGADAQAWPGNLANT